MTKSRKPVTGRTRALIISIDRAILWLSKHWLGLFNSLAGLYVTLPFLAPFLVAWNLKTPASVIYTVYSYLCHQQPQRSFFILGNQVAFCQRDVAIYMSVFLTGLVYGLSGRRWRPLPWWGVALMILPAVIDGSLQLFVTYESVWYVRVITGAITGTGAVWFLYPRFERAFGEVRLQVTRQLQRAAQRDKEQRSGI